jgi:hypothetical protein
MYNSRYSIPLYVSLTRDPFSVALPLQLAFVRGQCSERVSHHYFLEQIDTACNILGAYVEYYYYWL